MRQSDHLPKATVRSDDRRTRRPEDNTKHRGPAAPPGTLCVGKRAPPLPGMMYRQKARYLLLAALSLCLSLQMSPALRAQDLVWAKRAGGTSSDSGAGIALDGAGNSYVTGAFIGSATFGPGETNETTLTSAGDDDIFVAKYDASGDLVWAKRAGGTGFDAGIGIAVDGSGNSYVTGFFQGSATFGPGETNETTLTSAGFIDIFVAKYDASGDLVWAKQAAGSRGATTDFGQGIAVDGAGNSYITGRFQGSAAFGAGETNETTLTSAGISDIFVAKYDASGDLVWAKRAGGTSRDSGEGIAVDGSGHSYVTGYFEDSATFGPGETNETTLTGAGDRDIFVAKYDASGDLVWANRAGGTSFDGGGQGIAVDGAGNSYITGRFQGSAAFSAGETNETTLTSAGISDIFVAKYDASGDLLWANRAGGTSTDFGSGIAADGAGNSYVTGGFADSATFGPGETNETTLTGAGGNDIFVAKYDASGALVRAKRAGGTSSDGGQGIAVDDSGKPGIHLTQVTPTSCSWAHSVLASQSATIERYGVGSTAMACCTRR